MVRIAIQVKELISSNVSSALDKATDPAKMMARLQGEIEEALIGLHGDFVRKRRQKERLEGALETARAQQVDWGDKAKIAMDHAREDLARQSLLARENCRKTVAHGEVEIERLAAELAEIEDAERQLEEKREEVRRRHSELLSKGGSPGCGDQVAATSTASASRTERRMDRIEVLEKRTDFAVGETSSNASIEREIEAMQRDRAIEEELASLRETSPSAPKKKPAKKRGKQTKVA